MKKLIVISLVLITYFNVCASHTIKKSESINSSQLQFRSSECKAPTSRIDLDINNVRTTILNGGDMWWDLSNAKYEIPKGSGKHSIYAGSIMIGGKDETGNIKMAALTHRTNGSDFWAGPINKNNMTTTSDVCDEYDKHFKVNRKEVEDYIFSLKAGENPTVPLSMLNYPAHGNIADGHDYYLAPFFDADSNGVYNPSSGDYPAFDLGGNNERYANGKLRGDQNIWWIFNDVGNVHTESGASAIGIEIQAQAFAFATNDEINDMTFYNYKFINRSTFTLQDCYMGVWADTDLGYAHDDYVGCDVERGLGYCYNGDAYDENSEGYGIDPPAIGVDFFEGPLADVNDGVDNDRDGIIDEQGELIVMSKFMYYNIGSGDQGDPNTATDYFNYIRGRWKNGSPMEYGGNGFNTSGIGCDFMFPDDSDQQKYWGTKGVVVAPWSETSAGNAEGDRRFIQSAGPFTLEPGAVNYITTGAIWAQANPGEGPWSAVQNLKKADDLAQVLFDNGFKILNGPDAPDLIIQEMKNELIFYLENTQSSNNYKEEYQEVDATIVSPIGVSYDSTYKFQGYQVFQLANSTVSSSQLDDVSKARLVWQSDIKDGVTKLVNHIFDKEIGFNVPQIMVDGADEGVLHSFSITRDYFAIGDDRLVNNKEYYYLAIAYAYNDYLAYQASSEGQKFPYKAGRRNIKQYTAIPHDASLEGNGTKINSVYGLSPKVKRVLGNGNGGQFVNLSNSSIEEILSSATSSIDQPTYNSFGSPIGVKVIDPIKIPKGEFRIEFMDSITPNDLSDAYWRILYKPEEADEFSDTVYSDKTIQEQNEQILKQWGISVNIKQVSDVGTPGIDKFGIIGDSMNFKNSSLPWLSGISDVEGDTWLNWIRAGNNQSSVNTEFDFKDYFVGQGAEDTNGEFEKLVNGWVAPFKYCSREKYGLASGSQSMQESNDLSALNNVDLVITSDQTNWSICPVLEMSDDKPISQYGDEKLELKRGVTKDWDGNDLEQGLSYFPGYAIDVLTGERLNIAFGEYSFYAGDNGADMIWNPTSSVSDNQGVPLLGGFHTIYIFRNHEFVSKYDRGESILTLFNQGYFGIQQKLFKSCTWVYGYPIQNDAFSFLATDVTIKLRVNEPYTLEDSQLPVYEFNTYEIYAAANQNEIAKANLDKTNIVPNPYYGFSEYEKSKINNQIKITNLPKECTVKIFTLDGSLVKTLKKDNDEQTSISWNLKNEQGINVASGLYIFHVNAPGIGEKIIKWFGVQRQIDLDSF
ncbi:MAG: hypothetical protein CMD18_06135 [Flavobacteriales bacterium]|nr:hypothetical protein [Flavobacteriales bacterium]